MADDNELQIIQQNLNQILAQKQQFQMQLNEIESALGEIKGSSKVYKIVGSIMVESSEDKIKGELEKKKSSTELRIKNFEDQEQKLRDKAKKIQEEVVKQLNKNG